MRVLILHHKQSEQAHSLAEELAQSNVYTDITDQLNPLRLLLNKYDLIHCLTNHNEIGLAHFLGVLTAKTLNIPTLLTVYSHFETELNTPYKLNYFDALTVPYISELKKTRWYNKPKMILPFLPLNYKHSPKWPNQHESFKSRSFVFPIVSSFDELKSVNFSLLRVTNAPTDLYVDARLMKKSLRSSSIRKTWQNFTSENPYFKSFTLFTEDKTFFNLFATSQVYTFLHHLKIGGTLNTEWTLSALSSGNFLVLHEDQATAFSHFWKTEENCFIFSSKVPTDFQYSSLNETLAKENFLNKEDFNTQFKQSIDLKINELIRLYTKIVSQKRSLSHNKSQKV